MADDVKATDAAKALAEEEGVDLASVQGTGADGQVTKPDVEAALESASERFATDKLIYAEFNPKLGDTDRLVVYDLEGNSRVLTDDPSSRIMTESEFEEFNRVSHPPTHLYPRAFKFLQRGREV